MADESAEIKNLVRLRKQRPAFSRMISWEISQAAEQEPVKKTKLKKKKAAAEGTQEHTETNEESDGKKTDENVDEPDIESVDSSEYETACEDEEDIVVKTEDLGVTDLESQFESIGTDILELDDEDDIVDGGKYDDDSDDELFLSSFGSDKKSVQTSDETQPGRRRRLSKKQKRKRKRYFKVTYLDDLYNLGNLFDVTDEISDVFTEVLASEPNTEIKCRVPTLVELCLRVNRRKQRSNSERQRNVSGAEKDKITVAPLVIPHGMKKLMSSWGRDQKQLENQLSFFLNKVLPIVEEKISEKRYICEDHRNDDNKQKLTFQKRSIWSVLPFPPSKDMQSRVQYASEKSPAFLFTPSMHYHEEIQNEEYSYHDYYRFGNVTLTSAMWALATTVDLMLPSQTNTTAIIRVKRALNLRYKRLVETLFEYVLPYVMWARGKVATATDMFRTLVEKETEADTKAMYLSEIGRMHAMFGDAGTAEQFYRIATETALEDLHGERKERCINEVTEQKQVLLASISDTGVLNKQKSMQSLTYWSGVKNLPGVRNTTLIAGCDAFLCYHLSHCSDSKLYDDALSKLEKMTEGCNYLYYYQSLIHALQGSADISTRLYRESRSSCHHTPGDAVLSRLGRKAKNPWQPLLDVVNAQKSEVKPLTVIWRTNLQVPRVSKHRPMEAQVNSQKLNLRQNEAGRITGDMQMTLPPLRDISLDPYTGLLMIDNIPSHTGMWTSSFLPADNAHFCDLLVPTPMLIYTGEDGTTVHMVKPSNTSSGARETPHYSHNGPPCPFMLYWTSPSGQMAKLNLLTAVRSQIKKSLIKEFEDKHDYYINNMKFDEEQYKKLFKYVEVAYEKSYSLTSENIANAVSRAKARKKNGKKKEKGEQNLKLTTKKSILSHFLQQKSSLYEECELAEEPFVYGKTIALIVKGQTDRSNSGRLLTINTEDRSSFLSYELLGTPGNYVIVKQGRNNYTSEEYLMYLKKSELMVLNERGEVILNVEDSQVASAARDGCPPVIIYPNLFGVNKDKNGIWRAVIGLEPVIADIEDKLCWTVGSVYDELALGSSKEPSLLALTHIGEKTDSTGKLLMVNLVGGLGFIDPGTMDFVAIKVREDCASHFEFTTGNKVLKGAFEDVQILAEKTFTVDNKAVCRVAFGVENKVFVLDLSHTQGGETAELEMICSLVLPGLVKEICLIGKQVGMLISLTQHHDVDEQYYREHVFYFDFDGHLHGVLLCLNRGPRSFLPVYLRGNNGSGEGEGTDSGGWHVYLRDGRDGIMCVRLHS